MPNSTKNTELAATIGREIALAVILHPMWSPYRQDSRRYPTTESLSAARWAAAAAARNLVGTGRRKRYELSCVAEEAFESEIKQAAIRCVIDCLYYTNRRAVWQRNNAKARRDFLRRRRDASTNTNTNKEVN